jgi:ubiquinone/menaquinone biosynthesis C-methylase UbiE
MDVRDTDKRFAGSIPELYERLLVPLLFESYAADLAERVRRGNPRRLLELAAGTGVLTRALSTALSPSAAITATDLNSAMLERAAARTLGRAIEWRAADAMELPFADASFDAVVCQFGAMFFPEKPVAFSEARRVLAPGGVFSFNVWDRLEENELAAVASAALEELFPRDPPQFLSRTPHGYHDVATIERDLSRAGFEAAASIATVPARSRAASAEIAAVAYCQGCPLRNEIEGRGPAALADATAVVARAIARRFGAGPVDAKIQAHVVTVAR